MTSGVLSVVREWTGVETRGCPWAAFYDPFVQRVLTAYTFFTEGQLAAHAPHASHRLIEGVGAYHRLVGAVQSKRMEKEREQAQRQRNRPGEVTARG